jgi:hypothetical protein
MTLGLSNVTLAVQKASNALRALGTPADCDRIACPRVERRLRSLGAQKK